LECQRDSCDKDAAEISFGVAYHQISVWPSEHHTRIAYGPVSPKRNLLIVGVRSLRVIVDICDANLWQYA